MVDTVAVVGVVGAVGVVGVAAAGDELLPQAPATIAALVITPRNAVFMPDWLIVLLRWLSQQSQCHEAE
jgi:hypothetical protein